MMKARSLAGLLLIVFTIGCATAQDAKVRGTTAANAGHFADAYRYWLPLAEAGDPEVQEAIALLLESENDLGLAVPARERQLLAQRWVVKSAMGGRASAAKWLSDALANGWLGLDKSESGASCWLRVTQGSVKPIDCSRFVPSRN